MDTYTRTIANDPLLSDGSDSVIVDRVDIDSGEMTSVVLGIYEDDFPQPNFHLEVFPKNAIVNATLVRTEDTGEYKLTYHLQNFQDNPCRVVIRKCEIS